MTAERAPGTAGPGALRAGVSPATSPRLPGSLPPRIGRRAFAGALGAVAWPWPAAAARSGPPLRLVQCVDTSATEQEHARDYAAGAQTAVQWANRNGGGTRPLQLEPFPCDGSPASMDALLQRLRGDDGLLGLAATTSERLSLAVVHHLTAAGLELAHLAPWLPDSRHDGRAGLVTLFASREHQLRQALQLLKSMGLQQLGVVFDSPGTRERMQDVLGTGAPLPEPQRSSWAAPEAGGVEALVQARAGNWPPVLVFAGGALELARFVKALAGQGVQRLVVHVGDVDLGLLDQLGARRAQPLVLTQVVPHPASPLLACARMYRELHTRLYDDAPSTAGMAGYLAGRYLVQLLDRLPPGGGRTALLDTLRRRDEFDLDGYRVRFDAGSNRGSRFVNQVMIARDGRLVV